MDESNATCGKRLESIGLENTVESRQAYRELLVTTPGLGEYISGEFWPWQNGRPAAGIESPSKQLAWCSTVPCSFPR